MEAMICCITGASVRSDLRDAPSGLELQSAPELCLGRLGRAHAALGGGCCQVPMHAVESGKGKELKFNV